jgi:hypothetical protein
METAEALVIIRALADGRDPARNGPLAHDSVFLQPDVMRALQCAMEVLMDVADKPKGGVWSREEERRLVAGFETGVSLTNIAKAHGRTRGAILSRLKKLGLIGDGGGVPAGPLMFRFEASLAAGKRAGLGRARGARSARRLALRES